MSILIKIIFTFAALSLCGMCWTLTIYLIYLAVEEESLEPMFIAAIFGIGALVTTGLNIALLPSFWTM